jgi:hypothetical protein
MTFAGANLSITPRPITVTADAQSKVYGSADPALTYQVTNGMLLGSGTFSELLNFDGVPNFSGELSRVSGESVGDYAIEQGNLSAGTNYVLSYVGAKLTITRKVLLAQADDKSRVFGQTNPVFTVTFSGLVNGDGTDALDSLPTAGSAATPASAPGSYAITLTGGADDNYEFNLAAGTLTITTPASVSITSIIRFPDSSIRLSGTGETNIVYTVQASDDLTDWQPIGTVATGGTVAFQFDDLGATNQAFRFYRIALP